MSGIQQLVIELRRRRVFRVAGLYVVGCWVILQVAALAFQSLDIPDSALRWVWIATFAGFPLTMIFGWRYDITGHGIVRTPQAGADNTGELALRPADYIILSLLAFVAATVSINLFSEIQQTAPGAATSINVQRNSLAVLPLGNLSGDPEQEYFVSGMHEALIADLARIGGLKVISRVSTEQFRDSTATAAEIGADLGVAYLIEGSVMHAGDQVRITVQLIDAATDEHVWAENYERDLVNVLRLQGSVARAIANQVKVKLTPYEEEQLAAGQAIDPEAYKFYLRGRFHWYKFTDADLKLSLDYFQRAVDKDPGYPLAYVGFADALATTAHAGLTPTTQVFPAATQFVRRALELDENLAEAHDLLARIHFAYDWDWGAADRGFRRAISLKPGYPDVHVVYSQFLAIMNRWDESLAEAEAGLSLDPLNPWFRLEYAERLHWFGQSDNARRDISALIESQPDWFAARRSLWDIALDQQEFDVAVQAAHNYFRLLGESEAADLLGSASTEDEYRPLMLAVAEVLENRSIRPYVANVDFAKLRMHAGDYDAALGHLEEAFRQHESLLAYTVVDPLFRPLWNTGRFRELRRNINL